MEGSLTVKAIEAGLRTRWFGRPLSVYGVVDSTNDIARELAEEGASEGTAVLAKEQTGGRGRQGRRWISPPGGLWLSVVLRPAVPADVWPLIGFAASAGTAAAIDAVTGVRTQLKWPNDLVLNARKLGGVLVESSPRAAILGVGVNANVEVSAFPEEVRSGATSLLSSLGRPVDLAALVKEVLVQIEGHYDQLQRDPRAVLDAWRRRSYLRGRRVAVVGAEVIEGVAGDIAADGALLIRTASGVHPVRAADVSVREAGPA